MNLFNNRKKSQTNALNGFFPHVMVLNQQTRPDRLEQFRQEAAGIGLYYDVFASIPHPRSFTSFNLSVYTMLAQFYATGLPQMLMLEDDVVFSPDTMKLAAKAIDALPAQWDMLYLGCNVIGDNVRAYKPELARVTGAWTTHAVGISRRVAGDVLKAGINVCGEGVMLDDWLAKNIHPRGWTFCVRPMLAKQRPGFSNLWNRATDYDKIFQDAGKKVEAAV